MERHIKGNAWKSAKCWEENLSSVRTHSATLFHKSEYPLYFYWSAISLCHQRGFAVLEGIPSFDAPLDGAKKNSRWQHDTWSLFIHINGEQHLNTSKTSQATRMVHGSWTHGRRNSIQKFEPGFQFRNFNFKLQFESGKKWSNFMVE